MDFSEKDWEAIQANKNLKYFNQYHQLTGYEKHHPYLARRAMKQRRAQQQRLLNGGVSTKEHSITAVIHAVALGVLVIVIIFVVLYIRHGLGF